MVHRTLAGTLLSDSIHWVTGNLAKSGLDSFRPACGRSWRAGPRAVVRGAVDGVATAPGTPSFLTLLQRFLSVFVGDIGQQRGQVDVGGLTRVAVVIHDYSTRTAVHICR